MDWETYEKVVRDIYKALGKKKEIEIIGYGNTCKVIGKSGVEHQVDVLTKYSDGLHEYKTAIECKYWNQNINKDILMKIEAIVQDCNLNKGVVVSKLGFTPDAKKYAEYANIGLVELREPVDNDWEGRIKDIVINMKIQAPRLLNFQVMVNSEEELIKMSDHIASTSDSFVIYPDSSRETFGEIIDNFFRDNFMIDSEEPRRVEERDIILPEGSIVVINGETEIIPKGFKIKGQMDLLEEKIEIKGKNYIWMIMKSIFEKKEFIITPKGELIEQGIN